MDQNLSLYFGGDIRPENLAIKNTVNVLLCYDRLIRAAATVLYGPKCTIRVGISHIRPGSLDIDGLISVVAGTQPFLPEVVNFGVRDIPQLISKWLDILKFLKGSPPQSVTQTGDGQNVNVTNQNGQSTIINGNVYNACTFLNIGKISEPLQKPVDTGAEFLDLISNKRRIKRYTRQDVKSFNELGGLGDSREYVSTLTVYLVSPVLEGPAQWRFRYGTTTFRAEILDVFFLEQVARSEVSFKRGDKFTMRIRSIESSAGTKKYVTHQIIQVLSIDT
jgi:hypothetical protein